MKTSTIVSVLVVVVIVLGGWYWWSTKQAAAPVSPSGAAGLNGSSDQGNLGQADTGTPQQPQTKSATVIVASTDAKLGSFISSPVTGMTLYTFSNDTTGVSNCSGACAVNWPPYIVEPGITLLGGAGLSGQLGTVARAEGGVQLTYNGAPLYTYIKDTKPGDTTGQGVGGVWFIAKP